MAVSYTHLDVYKRQCYLFLSHLKAVSFICFIHSITTGKKNSNEKITSYVIGYFNK